MSDRIFTLLLSLSLTLLNVCAGFQVQTFWECNFDDNNSVNIICQHNANESWNVGASLFINGKNVCNDDRNSAECNGRKEGQRFYFTLRITPENKILRYHCVVLRSSPLPIQRREGEGFHLTQDRCHAPPPIKRNCLDTENNCPQVLLFSLSGFVLLLGLYCLIITALYITLRRKFSEELTMTYVSMQQNQVRPKKKVKGHGADKNAEYMDMREVHHHARHIRDVNHNSRLNHVGFSA